MGWETRAVGEAAAAAVAAGRQSAVVRRGFRRPTGGAGVALRGAASVATRRAEIVAGEGVVSATHYLEKARLASALPAHKVADGRDKQPAGQRAGAPPTPPPSAPTSSPPAAGGPSAPRAANGTEASGVAAATSDGAGVGAKSGRFAVRRSSLLCQDDRR